MKSTNKLPRWLIAGLIIPIVVLNGWLLLLVFQYFRSLVNIFVAASLLSFIFDYPVRQLEQWKLNRALAILIVLLLGILLVSILGVTLFPIVIEQFNGLLQRLPSWIDSGSQQIKALETWTNERNLPLSLSTIATQLLGRLSSQLQQLSGQIISGVFSAVGSVLDLILTIVLTFYMLLHGSELWDGLYKLLPPHLGEQLRQSVRQTFHNYFIGQATVAATMGVAMTVAFVIIQVPFGLLFGLGVGAMAFFPFGGALSIAIVSSLVTLKSIWLGVRVLVVATIIDQIVESAIAPRLLGGFTGLNPVLILLSLLTGAKIGGFLGLLVAVPAASFIKSLIAILQAKSEETSAKTEELAEIR
jgi:predicted PurR-regulated permease PerM